MSARAANAWAALPDAITAAMFALVWASPFAFGALSVKTAMLTMLLEFFLVHGTGFLTAFANARGASRARRIASLLGLSLFYAMMIGAVCASFGEWWPLLGFGWLLAGKILWVLAHPADDEDAVAWQMGAWGASVAAYLLGCGLTIIADIPRWGMTSELQPQFGLGGGGLWIDEPHRVVAFGVVYFGLLAMGKLLAAMWMARKQA